MEDNQKISSWRLDWEIKDVPEQGSDNFYITAMKATDISMKTL